MLLSWRALLPLSHSHVLLFEVSLFVHSLSIPFFFFTRLPPHLGVHVLCYCVASYLRCVCVMYVNRCAHSPSHTHTHIHIHIHATSIALFFFFFSSAAVVIVTCVALVLVYVVLTASSERCSRYVSDLAQWLKGNLGLLNRVRSEGEREGLLKKKKI